MQKKVGAITFHASYNHGSALQAYALQEYITKKLNQNFEYKIINLRTKRQKDLYNKPYGFYDFKSCLKKILYLPYRQSILKRKENYETFVANFLNTTVEFESLEDVKTANLDFDYYISGSDQIWNYSILDFDWSFFLEFCNDGKKISYAASLGPIELNIDKNIKGRIKNDLEQYSKISVRETKSFNTIKKITGRNDISINVDPTLLLNRHDWQKIINKRIIEGDYIFLYDLKGKKNAYDVADFISSKYHMSIVVVRERREVNVIHGKLIRKYDAGPIEFLNYLKNAKIVISSSFHGNVFSIIFEKPFLAIGGKHDARVGNLLNITELQHRSVDSIKDVENINNLFNANFNKARSAIAVEQKKTKAYFNDALDIKEDKNE